MDKFVGTFTFPDATFAFGTTAAFVSLLLLKTKARLMKSPCHLPVCLSVSLSVPL